MRVGREQHVLRWALSRFPAAFSPSPLPMLGTDNRIVISLCSWTSAWVFGVTPRRFGGHLGAIWGPFGDPLPPLFSFRNSARVVWALGMLKNEKPPFP